MILRLNIVILCFLINSTLFCQITTNQQIVISNTVMFMDSIASDLPDSLDVITLEINTHDHEVRTFLINQVARYFSKVNCTVSFDSAAYKLVIENFDIKIEYRENNAGMLGLNINLERLIRFASSGFLIDNRKKDIVNTFNYHTEYNDVIKASDLSEVENSPYSFCHGRRVNALAWTKYFKPAVIIASVAGVVLLLFTMRF